MASSFSRLVTREGKEGKKAKNMDDDSSDIVRDDGVVDSAPLPSTHEGEVSMLLQFSFLFLSFGYMLPWTSLGSLISYYKSNFGPGLYVKVYCAFYMAGLPVSLLQYKYDPILDLRFGSRSMYLWRGIFAYTMMSTVLISLIYVNGEHQYSLILLFTILGVCTWMIHGTASMMASMFPKAVVAYLQIGFRCPELYAIGMDYGLSIGKTASDWNLQIFYEVGALILLYALVVWILIVGSHTSKKYFDNKDFKEEKESFKDEEANNDLETAPLLSISVPPPHRSSSGGGGGGGGGTNRSCSDTNALSALQQEADGIPVVGAGSNRDSDNSRNSKSSPLALAYTRDKVRQSPKLAAAKLERDTEEHAKSLLLHTLSGFTKEEDVFSKIWPLTLALLVTMYGSIFQAAFFAFVDSPDGRNIEQILYFLRLVCDLLGRPLTFLPRPSFLKTNTSLLYATLSRTVLLCIFFAYTFIPSFPKNDWFICGIVGIFSILNGYFSVLIYEYAASADLNAAGRTHATSILNMAFQLAAFTAVGTSISITYVWLRDYDNPYTD